MSDIEPCGKSTSDIVGGCKFDDGRAWSVAEVFADGIDEGVVGSELGEGLLNPVSAVGIDDTAADFFDWNDGLEPG